MKNLIYYYVKRADKRKMDELRVEIGVKESLNKKLVRVRDRLI